MEYRKLRESDIAAFVENRIEFVKIIGDVKEIELFRVKNIEYIKKILIKITCLFILQ